MKRRSQDSWFRVTKRRSSRQVVTRPFFYSSLRIEGRKAPSFRALGQDTVICQNLCDAKQLGGEGLTRNEIERGVVRGNQGLLLIESENLHRN